MRLAQVSGLEIVSIDYKDTPEKALAFLAASGNPFARIGDDENGRAGIEWGVAQVPETFYVGADGAHSRPRGRSAR